MTALITFEGATLGYGKHIVLRDLSFEIREGDYLGLVTTRSWACAAIDGTRTGVASTIARSARRRTVRSIISMLLRSRRSDWRSERVWLVRTQREGGLEDQSIDAIPTTAGAQVLEAGDQLRELARIEL